MGGSEFMTLLVVLALVAAYLYPVWRILKRLGYEGGKAALFLIGMVLLPGIGVVLLLWILAYDTWPVLGKDAA